MVSTDSTDKFKCTAMYWIEVWKSFITMASTAMPLVILTAVTSSYHAFQKPWPIVFLKYRLNKQLEKCGILAQRFLHPALIVGNKVYCKMSLIKVLTLDIIGKNLVWPWRHANVWHYCDVDPPFPVFPILPPSFVFPALPHTPPHLSLSLSLSAENCIPSSFWLW